MSVWKVGSDFFLLLHLIPLNLRISDAIHQLADRWCDFSDKVCRRNFSTSARRALRSLRLRSWWWVSSGACGSLSKNAIFTVARFASEPYLHGNFFNKMIPMNFLCSSGFLTNSFMMKLHKILNLPLLPLAGVRAFFLCVLESNAGKISPTREPPSRFASALLLS